MLMTERNQKIYEMRESGMTFYQISTHFDISKSRAAQIFNKEYEKREYYPPLKKLLSTRMIRALVRLLGSEQFIEEPKIIIDKIKYSELIKVRDVGKKSKQELAAALIKLRYIKKNDNWLKY
jgi:hypothetical protein